NIEQVAMPLAQDELRHHADGLVVSGKAELAIEPGAVAAGPVALGVHGAVHAYDLVWRYTFAQQHVADAIRDGDDLIEQPVFEPRHPLGFGVVDAPGQHHRHLFQPRGNAAEHISPAPAVLMDEIRRLGTDDVAQAPDEFEIQVAAHGHRVD